MTRSLGLRRTVQHGTFYVLLLLLPFSISAVEVGFVVLLAGWLYDRWDPRTRQDTVWRRPSLRPVAWGIAGLLAAGALSVLFSRDPALSLKGLIFKWAEYLCFTVIVADVAVRPGVLRRATAVVAVSAFAVVLEGLSQEMWGRGLLKGYPWVTFARMTGPYQNPIDLATYLSAATVWLATAAVSERGWRRSGLWMIFSMVIACFGRTMALGSWAAFAIACVAVLMFTDRIFRRTGAALLAGIAVAGGFFLWRTQMTWAILSLSDVGTSDRSFMWESALRMIADRPVFGHGINTFMGNYLVYWVGGEYQPRYAHNCYLQMAAEVGLVGAGFFLWLLWAMGRRIWAALRGPASDERWLLAGLATGLLAFAIHAGVDTNFYSVRQAALFWVLAGIACGLSERLDPPRAS